MRKKSQTKDASNAILIHRYVKRSPATKDDICAGIGITEAEFASALRFSRSNTDPAELANEIIGVTNSAPYLYYATKNVEQAEAYISQRAKIADGHLRSVERLLVKELQKYPEKSREISLNLTAVKRMREDMVYLLGD